MKRTLLLLTFLLASLAVFCQPSVKFLDIEWGTSEKDARAAMVGRGFRFFGESQESAASKCLKFSGRFAERKSSVYMYLANDRLYSVEIIITPIVSQSQDYAFLRNALIEKYGEGENKIVTPSTYFDSIVTWDFGAAGSITFRQASYDDLYNTYKLASPLDLVLTYTDGDISKRLEEMEKRAIELKLEKEKSMVQVGKEDL